MNKLSIVIPAYNEEKRLPSTLKSLIEYLPSLGIPYEILIVDDGSRDQTKSYVEQFSKKYSLIRIVSYHPNHGRGFAVRTGVLRTNGDLVLEMDSDASVIIEAIGRCVKYLLEHPEIDALFGSRELPDSKILNTQPLLRVILGKGFIYLAKITFGLWNTHDFTLGFKMFRRKAAQDIFSHQWDNHYVAEAEIVYIAHKRGWRFKEIPVSWTDNRDSRVHPFRDSLRSFKGLFAVLWRGINGIY